MSKKDYYEILNVSRDSSTEEIKKQYRKIALKYHPDRNPGDKQAEEKFKELSEAYHVLSDPKRRSAYDQFGHSGMDGRGGGMGDFENFFSGGFKDVFDDIFSSFTGGGSSFNRDGEKGSDLQYNLQISFEDAVKGNSVMIEYPRQETCNSCQGTGARNKKDITTCKYCHGTGYSRVQHGFISFSSTCSHCGGLGTSIAVPCKTCNGEGVVQADKKLTIQIPKGAQTGTRIRFSGEGEQGKGRAGDLYVVFHVEDHHIFRRDGNNVICELPIDIASAALGSEVIVPTLDGKVKFQIPPGSQSGKIFNLRGKGFTSSRGIRGDLLVKILVETPTNLSSKQKDLLTEFRKKLDKKQIRKTTTFQEELDKNTL